ncbi:phytanoyl-CoA dioxygenase family protein [Cytobacillus pseudoceanisediminis]|uniref:phytanoyl-CoA dioxygenase family protein n=1 Tax=Cytobacillus pseudoceanisediminis TaxID=3051614 RepID=UPI003C2B5D43
MTELKVVEYEKNFYEQEGYIVIKNVFTKQELSELKLIFEKEWLNMIRENVIQQDKKSPLNSLFPPIRSVWYENEEFRNWLTKGKLFQIVESFLGEEALAVGSTMFFKGPGAKELPMHQDNYDIGAYPKTSCAVWIGIDATDEENGGLTIVPKTHTLGMLSPRIPGHKSIYGLAVPIPSGYEKVRIETEIGDVVIFDGDLLHGSGPNKSDYRFRHAIVTHFAGVSTEKVFVRHDELINKNGEKISRPLNKKHSIKRLQPSK